MKSQQPPGQEHHRATSLLAEHFDSGHNVACFHGLNWSIKADDLKTRQTFSVEQHIPPPAVSAVALTHLRERLLYWTTFNAYCLEHVARCCQ